MFLKKKKLGPADRQSAARAPRYTSHALVRINGFEGKAVIKNVSSGGFRMESKTFVNMEEGSTYSIQITPEKESSLKNFELRIGVCWVQSSAEKFSVGFKIIEGESVLLEKYIEYLKNSA